MDVVARRQQRVEVAGPERAARDRSRPSSRGVELLVLAAAVQADQPPREMVVDRGRRAGRDDEREQASASGRRRGTAATVRSRRPCRCSGRVPGRRRAASSGSASRSVNAVDPATAAAAADAAAIRSAPAQESRTRGVSSRYSSRVGAASVTGWTLPSAASRSGVSGISPRRPGLSCRARCHRRPRSCSRRGAGTTTLRSPSRPSRRRRWNGAEMIVVEDDPADAATERLAAGYGARYVAHGEPRGLNAARNTAIDAAAAELLCFLDDDVEVWPAWSRRCSRPPTRSRSTRCSVARSGRGSRAPACMAAGGSRSRSPRWTSDRRTATPISSGART